MEFDRQGGIAVPRAASRSSDRTVRSDCPGRYSSAEKAQRYSVNDCIDALVEREGGYASFTDRPSDRGGPTRAGITLPALSDWLRRPATVADLKALTTDQIREFYRVLFYAPFACISADKLRNFLFDYAVNSGLSTAVKALQAACKVPTDGELGPQTVAALKVADPSLLFSCVFRDRLQRVLQLVFNDPDIHTFLIAHPHAQLWNLSGWIRRIAEFI